MLAQNYPNPFNPSTQIEFALDRATSVRLEVYDALGRRIATLVDDVRPAGRFSVRVDATGLPGGLYLYRLTTETGRQTRAMMLIK